MCNAIYAGQRPVCPQLGQAVYLLLRRRDMRRVGGSIDKVPVLIGSVLRGGCRDALSQVCLTCVLVCNKPWLSCLGVPCRHTAHSPCWRHAANPIVQSQWKSCHEAWGCFMPLLSWCFSFSGAAACVVLRVWFVVYDACHAVFISAVLRPCTHRGHPSRPACTHA